MTTVTSVPTICGEDAIHLGDEVWVNNLAPMAGRFGLVDCMPGVVVGFLRDGKNWLVSVKQTDPLARPSPERRASITPTLGRSPFGDPTPPGLNARPQRRAFL
jgi:hypothetical protein